MSSWLIRERLPRVSQQLCRSLVYPRPAMTKKGLAACVGAVALFATRAVAAQPQYTAPSGTPEWLQDRRYNEGIGIRAGDLEIHPGIAGEFGYDSKK